MKQQKGKQKHNKKVLYNFIIRILKEQKHKQEPNKQKIK